MRRVRTAAFSISGLVLAGFVSAGTAHAEDAGSSQTVRDLALVDSVSWGVNPSTMAVFHTLGREKWLQMQLHPTSNMLPKAVQAQIDGMPVSQKSALDLTTDFDTQSRAANQIVDPDQKAAAQKAVQDGMNDMVRQAATASILRALYSPDQLRERMTWFWFNHFNVHQYKANLRILMGDYEDKAIRSHALGRFRDLLTATLRHPAMIRYLDNADNAVGHINENYAREIMELHTMGVGSGYTQKDVEELARILTGVSIDAKPDNPKLKPQQQPLLLRDGLFEFNPARHDFGDKVLLGDTVKGRGYGEVEEAIAILCKQPATARHVSRQLAIYFAGDTPPSPLVDRMAQTFMRTDGDIASVLDTLFHSPEFVALSGSRFKDPVRYVFSAVRLAYDSKVIVNSAPIQNWLNRLAEGLYNHQTPDGYAMTSSAWNGSGEMMTRFEIARQIGSNSAGLFKAATADAVDQPAFPLLENGLYFSSLHLKLSAPTQTALDKAISPQDWNTLFLSSPEFMQ
ncbi:DUF1800 domain-containing protein (plasmid) [Phyllobacterium sp. 628]|uniref:DUF1800 domain-containing protein n=1 Tax=Phyllobacterium sp. 628 TaxID=2718938 RepID=UPI00166228EC|nr:DUF1800 domain-containing protein [Phyllobacterium sp. 628]QND54797.1 DUF1800 domain-containing protein [Phyllobacterium sp. 628]